MKINIVLALLLFYTQFTYGQEERKKKANYSKFFSRTYYVLKDNKSVMDGPYELTLMGTPIVQGQYDHTKKTGVWTYFNSMGEVIYKYDYSSDTLIEFNRVKFDAIQWQFDVAKNNAFQFRSGKIVPYVDFSNREFNVIKETGTIKSKLNRPPLLLGSSLKLQFELLDILRSKISDFKVMSYSLISFIVDSKGNTKNFKILSTSGLNFEDGLIKQLELKNLKWVPAKLGGENVDVEMTIPIIIKTDYNDRDYIKSNIIFTDIAFMNYYQSLKYKKDYKHLESWEYELFD
jgi:hypothetical protein